jgi:hypothetical protein
MSEDEASRRITAARVARRFPAVFPMVAAGRLHLSAIVTLSPWLKLRPELGDELLAAAAHKSRSELERLIAERFPRPDVPARVVELTSPATTESLLGSSAPARMPSSGFVKPPVPSAGVAPLSPSKFHVEYTFEQEDYDLLEYARVLLSHQVPNGDVKEISRRALRALVVELEKQMFGRGRKPRRGQRRGLDSRHVPRAVKAAVWKRDGGQCTFIGDHGQHCPARTRLEIDHIDPVARGGGSEAANLRLLCAAHNQFEAERVYGAAFMNGKREATREARSQVHADPWAQARTLARPQPRTRGPVAAPEPVPPVDAGSDAEVVEDAVAALRSLGYRERDARETLARCGLAPDATLEQHVRAALARLVRPLIVQSE